MSNLDLKKRHKFKNILGIKHRKIQKEIFDFGNGDISIPTLRGNLTKIFSETTEFIDNKMIRDEMKE